MLRDYQQLAVDQIRAQYLSGNKKVLLHLSTGGGKTVIFSHILKASAERGIRSIMVVRGRELVEQASQRLFRERVEHGVRMNMHWNRNYGALVQVCSIDTLISREQFPEAGMVVIDECDQATSNGYIKLASHYEKAFFLGVTATPYTSKSLKHIANAVVQPITTQELINRGYLVPPRYYAPSEPDMSGVRVQNDEFVAAQVFERMGTITGDIVGHWQKLGQNRPTICFAVNIKHSHQICDLFNAQGIPTEHCDADTSDSERKAILRRLENGTTKVVCNVGILCRGVDMPYVSCIVMARPTRSYNLYIQQAGRGTRPHSNKSDFLLIDHAGNVPRHGFITVEPPVELDGSNKKARVKEFRVVICKKCFLAYQGKDCPDCGPLEANARNNEIEIEPGNLKELVVKEEDPILQFILHSKRIAKQKGYKPGWVWHKLVEKFGFEAVQSYLPKWFIHHQNDPFANSPFRGAFN